MVLAEKVQLNQATISAIETGRSSVRLDTLIRVMSALGLELLIGGRPKNPPGW